MEVMIAVVIMGILSGLVGLSYMTWISKSRIQQTRMQLSTLKNALQLYRAEQGRLPTEEQGLAALCQAPTSAPLAKDYPTEGYLDRRRMPMDAWDNEYAYFVPGRQDEPYEIVSYGSDGEEGGEGDAADLSTSDL